MTSIQTFGSGSVINPKAINKSDIGTGPFHVNITEVIQNGNDDCLFVKIIYPDGKMQMHQCFLPFDQIGLQTQIINAFNYLYGKKVEAEEPIKNINDLIGSTLTYSEIL